jgi:hypothetical protein
MTVFEHTQRQSTSKSAEKIITAWTQTTYGKTLVCWFQFNDTHVASKELLKLFAQVTME